MVIGFVGTFFQIATLVWKDVGAVDYVEPVIGVIWNIYAYICIYSLYTKFKNEKSYKIADDL